MIVPLPLIAAGSATFVNRQSLDGSIGTEMSSFFSCIFLAGEIGRSVAGDVEDALSPFFHNPLALTSSFSKATRRAI